MTSLPLATRGVAPGVRTLRVVLALRCGTGFFFGVSWISSSSSSSLSNPSISTSPFSSSALIAASSDDAADEPEPEGLKEASDSSAEEASEDSDEDTFDPLDNEPDFFFLLEIRFCLDLLSTFLLFRLA